MPARLTEKQRRFVSEYLVDLNATAAARRAGYKDPNKGRQLVTKSNVSEAIRAAIEEREKRTEITQDAVLKELAAIGFANASDFETVTGGAIRVIDTKNVNAQKLPALAGVRETQNGIEIKLHDKVRALELLGKHLGMFDGRSSQTYDSAADDPITAALKEEMKHGAL